LAIAFAACCLLPSVLLPGVQLEIPFAVRNIFPHSLFVAEYFLGKRTNCNLQRTRKGKNGVHQWISEIERAVKKFARKKC
jgi:hypothetical protein